MNHNMTAYNKLSLVFMNTFALSVPFPRIYGIEGAGMAYLVANTFAALL